MSRCACGNMTFDPEGICKICRRKSVMPETPEMPEMLETPAPPKSKYPTCPDPECGKKFVDKGKLFVHMNATGHTGKLKNITKEVVVAVEKKVCVTCGKEFEAKRKDKTTCSKKCYYTLSNKRYRGVGRKKKSPEPPPIISRGKCSTGVGIDKHQYLHDPKVRALLGQLMFASQELDGEIASIIETGKYETSKIFDINRRLKAVIMDDFMPSVMEKVA